MQVQRSVERRAQRRSLALTPLESRVMLAAGMGDVTAVASGGNLLVTGDYESNWITITQGVTADEFVVTGLGTTVNGGASATVGGITGKISINMGDGDDEVTFSGAAAPGALSFVGGSGDDVLVVGTPSGSTSITGDLSVKDASGYLTVNVAYTGVGGSIKVDNRGFSGLVNIYGVGVAKDVNITTPKGYQDVNIDYLNMGCL